MSAVTETARDGTLSVTVGADGDLLRCQIESPGPNREWDYAVVGDRLGKLYRAAALQALHDSVTTALGTDAGLVPAATPAAIAAYRTTALTF